MTDVKKIDVSKKVGAASPDFQLQKLAETVNLLQGTTDQDQRAVRMFEFNQKIQQLEERMKKAGI